MKSLHNRELRSYPQVSKPILASGLPISASSTLGFYMMWPSSALQLLDFNDVDAMFCSNEQITNGFYPNYSDLTRPHPKWWFSKGNPFISGKSRLVKYYNLARTNGFPLFLGLLTNGFPYFWGGDVARGG